MRDIIITVDPKTRKTKTSTLLMGVVGENMQGNFIVDFVGEDFIDGVCWLEFATGKKKVYIALERQQNNTYVCPIKSAITQEAGNVVVQVRITQTAEDDTLIFKSDKFVLSVLDSINAFEEAPDEYPEWIVATPDEDGAKASTSCIHYIPEDAITTEDGTTRLATRWIVNGIDGITEPHSGMTALLLAPTQANSQLVLSIDGGQTFHPVSTNAGGSYANYNVTVGKPIHIAYSPNRTERVYVQDGVMEEVQGVWYVVNSTDKNDRVLITPANTASDNKWYHLLSDSNSGEVQNTSYASAKAGNKVKVNPYTGEIDVQGVKIDGEDLFDMLPSGGGASLTMPVIRVVTVADVDRTGIISPTNPLRITIATEGGTLLPTDTIQLCSRKAFTYKVCDEREDATRQRGRRWRLRKIAEKTAKECHPDKSMADGIYRMICWASGDGITPRAFLRSDNKYSSTRTVTKYVRVARLVNDDYIHSNAVPIQFTVEDLVKPEKNEAKINVR